MFLAAFFASVEAKRYSYGQMIPVYANKVSPYQNPSEAYDYYSLPFCPYSGSDNKAPRRLGDAFLGNMLKKTDMMLNYTVAMQEQTVCKISLDQKNLDAFTKAIEKQFYFELYVDKLPVWAHIGAVSKDKSDMFIFTRHHFNVYYNNDRIIDVTLTAENPFKLELNRVVKFTYSVDWTPTDKGKADRMERYKNDEFFKSSVRYLSLVNTIIIVLILIVVTILILFRALNNDLIRYEKENEVNEFEIDFRAERGWKMLHADVFRRPRFGSLLSILIGIGAHVGTSLVVFLVTIVVFGKHMDRNANLIASFIAYSIGAFFGGYFAAGIHKRWGGTKWIRHLFVVTLTVPIAFTITESVLNGVSLAYGSMKVLRLSSVFAVIVWYVVFVIPITVFGGIVGRHFFIVGKNPTRVGLIKRTIPPTPFFLQTWFMALAISVLSVSSISMEINYVMTSLWQYKMHYVWGFSLITVLLLFIVVGCSTVVAVYLRLSHENYEWHWMSFIAPFSVTFLVFGYGVYYFFAKTEMSGALQTLHYFAYTSILSCIIGVTCGFIGFVASASFVRRIYTNIKTD